MNLQEFKALVDKPIAEVGDGDLLAPLADLFDCGREETRAGIRYLQFVRPKLFYAVARLFRSAGLNWFNDLLVDELGVLVRIPVEPQPVDDDVQGVG